MIKLEKDVDGKYGDYFITSVIGDDTECKVYFEFQPSARAIYYGENMHPAIDSKVTIKVVLVNNDNFLSFLSEDAVDAYRIECFDAIDANDE